VPGQQAVIDAGIAEFAESPGSVWDPAGTAGEFLSRESYPDATKFGAIFGTDRFTRLITYSNLKDLEAVNQSFGRCRWARVPKGLKLGCRNRFAAPTSAGSVVVLPRVQTRGLVSDVSPVRPDLDAVRVRADIEIRPIAVGSSWLR